MCPAFLPSVYPWVTLIEAKKVRFTLTLGPLVKRGKPPTLYNDILGKVSIQRPVALLW